MADGVLPVRPNVRVRTDRVAAVLGTDLGAARIAEVLEPIGFATAPVGDDLEVVIPTWRYDSASEIDVIEEIARHRGYTELGRTVPKSTITGGLSARRVPRTLRRTLTGLGLAEAMPSPSSPPASSPRCGCQTTASRSPTHSSRSSQSCARPCCPVSWAPSRTTGPIATTASACSRRVTSSTRRHDPDAELPDEREALGVVLGGRGAPDAVTLWRVVAEALGVTSAWLENAVIVPGLHPTRAAVLRHGEQTVGHLR